LNVSSDEFQKMMTQLFPDLSFVHAFMDDVLVTSNGTYEDHIEKVSQVLERLATKNLQVNVRKSCWAEGNVMHCGGIKGIQDYAPWLPG